MVIVICAVCSPVLASKAPPDMQQFNVACPTSKLLPLLDAAYHSCRHGYIYSDGHTDCEKFVEIFRQLLPEYDCQLPEDDWKKYIVPAIWLAGPGAEEDYIHLLWQMSSSKDKLFTGKFSKPYQKAVAEAKRLFGSKEFRRALGADLAEVYFQKSKN